MSGAAVLGLRPARLSALAQPPAAGQFDIGLVGDVYLRDEYLAGFGVTDRAGLAHALWQPLANASLIVANLEAPVTDRVNPLEDKPYLHKTSAATLTVFDDRFVLSLANNHIMDFGAAGLADTLAALDAAGIRHAGAGLTLAQASAPCRLAVDGVDVAVLCAADPRFHPATQSTPGTFPAHRELLTEAVRAAASDGAIVVVSLHMGLEHVSVPSPTQVALAETCLMAGATTVQFHHSHCQAGAAANERGVALFGTGNYIWSKPTKLASSRHTACWCIRLDRDSRRVVAIGATPAFIDAHGLPIPLEERAAQRQLNHLQMCCETPLSGWHRGWLQQQAMLRPGFVYMNAHNYAAVLRKRGPRHTLGLMARGVRAQLFGTRR